MATLIGSPWIAANEIPGIHMNTAMTVEQAIELQLRDIRLQPEQQNTRNGLHVIHVIDRPTGVYLGVIVHDAQPAQTPGRRVVWEDTSGDKSGEVLIGDASDAWPDAVMHAIERALRALVCSLYPA